MLLSLLMMSSSLDTKMKPVLVVFNQSEDNEGTVKELLQRGDNLQQRITDERKREEIKIKQQLLQTKHNALKVLELKL